MLPVYFFGISCAFLFNIVIYSSHVKKDIRYITSTTLRHLFPQNYDDVKAKFLSHSSLVDDYNSSSLGSKFKIHTENVVIGGLHALEEFLCDKDLASYEDELSEISESIQTLNLAKLVIFRRALFHHLVFARDSISETNRTLIESMIQRLNFEFVVHNKEVLSQEKSIQVPDLQGYTLLNKSALTTSSQLKDLIPYYYPVLRKLMNPKGKLKGSMAEKVKKVEIPLSESFEDYYKVLKLFPNLISSLLLTWDNNRDFKLKESPNNIYSEILENQVRLSMLVLLPQCSNSSSIQSVTEAFLAHYIHVLTQLKLHKMRLEKLPIEEHLHNILVHQMKLLVDHLGRIAESLSKLDYISLEFTSILTKSLHEAIDDLNGVELKPFDTILVEIEQAPTSGLGNKDISTPLALCVDTIMFDALVTYVKNIEKLKTNLKSFEYSIVDPLKTIMIVLRGTFNLTSDDQCLIYGQLKLWAWFLFYYGKPCIDPQKCSLNSLMPLRERKFIPAC